TGTHEDALDCLAVENVAQVRQLQVSATHTNLVEGATLGEHVIPLACCRGDANDVERVRHSATVGEVFDRGNRILFARVDDVHGTTFLGSFPRFIIQVDHDDLRCASDDLAADGIETHAAGAGDGNGCTLLHLRCVEERTGTCDHATTQDCGLWERHLFGDGDQHVLVHQCLLGEPAQAHALVQCLAITVG